MAAVTLFTVGSVLIYLGTTLLQEDSERALAILILGSIGVRFLLVGLLFPSSRHLFY